MFGTGMVKLRDIKVVLRSREGYYLAGGPNDWEFTNHLGEAAVFNYLADEIETQLETIQRAHGLILEAVNIAAHDLCETCDRCNDTLLPTIAFYNGKEFLCPNCSRTGLSGPAI